MTSPYEPKLSVYPITNILLELSQNNIVQIILGNANQVFNYHNGTDYYFFAVRDVQNNPVLMMLKIHHPLMSFEPIKLSEVQRSELFDIEHLAFFKNKDPPLCEA